MKFKYTHAALAISAIAAQATSIFSVCVLVALLSTPLAMAGDGTPAGTFGNKRVLAIGIDGLRSDGLQAANTPNMDVLIAAGSVSYDAFAGGELGTATQQSTVSGPGWSSILTGVWADKHGITNNSFTGNHFDTYPHFFQRIGETNANAALASIVQWGPIDSSIVAPAGAFVAHRAIANTGQEIADQAVAYLGNNDPDVLFLHFDDVDHAGHASGYGPQFPTYLAAVSDVDRNIGELITAMKARPNFANEDWLVVILSDHGGIGTSHGGQTPEERTVFMIASGGSIPVQTVSPGPGHTALPPTVMSHLGIAINPAWGWENEPFGQPQVCLNSLACAVNQAAGTVTLSWNAPAAELNAIGIRVERDGQQVAELPLTATGWVDSPPVAGNGVSEFHYTVHSYGGSEGDSCPVRSCNAQFFKGVEAAGLIGYYPFDSDTAHDVSAVVGGSTSNNAGQWTGTAGYKDGAFGRAATVGNGAGSNFITASGGEYNFGATGSFTVIYWLNLKNNVSSDPVLISGGGKNWSTSGKTRGWLSFLNTGDDVGANIGDGTNRADTAVIDLDHDDYWATQGRPGEHWNFVAMVVDRAGQTLTNYVADDWVTATNPILAAGVAGRDFGPDDSTPTVTNISSVGNLTNGNLNIVMGQDGDGSGYSLPALGMDDVSIWNRPLSRAEIWQIYAEGRANGKSLGKLLADEKTCPAAFQSSVSYPDVVSLTWSAAAGLDATGIEILRDGTVIATLPITATSYVDHPSASETALMTYEYRLRILGGDVGLCPELTCTATVGGMPVAVFTENFDALTTGNSLSGQGGWGGPTDVKVVADPSSFGFSGKIAENNSTDNEETHPLSGLNDVGLMTMEFDLRIIGDLSYTYWVLGESGVSVGVEYGNLTLRGAFGGNQNFDHNLTGDDVYHMVMTINPAAFGGAGAATITYAKYTAESTLGTVQTAFNNVQLTLNGVGKKLSQNTNIVLRLHKKDAAAPAARADNLRIIQEVPPTHFLAYAFGMAPGASGTADYAVGPPAMVTPGHPSTTVTPGESSVDFRAVFSRRHSYQADGLSYTLQFSADLDFSAGHRKDVPVTDPNGPGILQLGTDGSVDIMSVSYPWLIETVNGYEKPTFFRVMINRSCNTNNGPLVPSF